MRQMRGTPAPDGRRSTAMSTTFPTLVIIDMRRTAEEVHAMALANLDTEYATITSTERLLDALRPPSDV